jgi:hypothetical protein
MTSPKFNSNFKITVPESLYQAVCANVDQPFADSYLSGATLVGTNLFPRTVTGWERMRDRRDFIDLAKRLDIKLCKPTPFPGENGDRLTARDLNW